MFLVRFALVLAVAAAAFAHSALAQPDYPARPVKLVVAFPPGGGADMTARLIASRMTEALGQPVVVENRPGANGAVGAGAVAKAAPDGYTLLLADRGAFGVNPSLYAKLSYDPLKDFEYVGLATTGPYVLVADPKLGVRSVSDLVTLAKEKRGALRYASYGVGSMPQLNLEAFNRRHDIVIEHVPYKGAAAAVAAVVSGEVAVTIASAPSLVGMLKDGRLRALAVGAPERLPLLPDVPTLAEADGGVDTLLPTFFAVAAPAGTPAPIVQRLNAEMRRALGAPEVAGKLQTSGLMPAAGSPEALSTTVREDLARFGALVKAIGIKPE